MTHNISIASLPPHTPGNRVVYSFFFFAPLTFAVPRRVFCRFLRCLPIHAVSMLIPNATHRHAQTHGCQPSERRMNVRCCLLAFSILDATPTRTFL